MGEWSEQERAGWRRPGPDQAQRRADVLLCALVVLGAAGGERLPEIVQHGGQHERQPPVRAQRVVMECGNDAATRRSFTREHGAAPIFVSNVRCRQSRR